MFLLHTSYNCIHCLSEKTLDLFTSKKYTGIKYLKLLGVLKNTGCKSLSNYNTVKIKLQ